MTWMDTLLWLWWDHPTLCSYLTSQIDQIDYGDLETHDKLGWVLFENMMVPQDRCGEEEGGGRRGGGGPRIGVGRVGGEGEEEEEGRGGMVPQDRCSEEEEEGGWRRGGGGVEEGRRRGGGGVREG